MSLESCCFRHGRLSVRAGHRQVVENINVIVSMYMDDALGDIQLQPEMGTVAFGSALDAFFVKPLRNKQGERKECTQSGNF